MPDLTIAPTADRDLEDIARYTEQRWSVARRRTYIDHLAARFFDFRDGRIPGRRRDDLQSGLLSHPCGGHLIFFRRNEAGDVEILRILHQAMDHEERL